MSLLARVRDFIAHFHLTGYASELPTSVTTIVEHIAETVENEVKAIETLVDDKFAALRAELGLKPAPAPVAKQPDPVVQPSPAPAAPATPAAATEAAPAATDPAPAAAPAPETAAPAA